MQVSMNNDSIHCAVNLTDMSLSAWPRGRVFMVSGGEMYR